MDMEKKKTKLAINSTYGNLSTEINTAFPQVLILIIKIEDLLFIFYGDIQQYAVVQTLDWVCMRLIHITVV